MRSFIRAALIALVLTVIGGQTFLVLGSSQQKVHVESFGSPEHDANPLLSFNYLNDREGNMQPVVDGTAGIETAIRAQRKMALFGGVGSTWTPLGPNPIAFPGSPYPTGTGRVLALAYASSTHTMYVGSASGGVWKSTDAGLTYSPLTDSMPGPAIGSLAVDPTNDNVIFAGTGELPQCSNLGCMYGMGVYKSTNGGTAWTQYGASTFAMESLSAIVVDPTNANRVFAGVADHRSINTSALKGVGVSSDGGQTWTKPSTAISGYDVTDLVVDLSGNLYAGVQGHGVYLSTDHGASWTPVNTGLPSSNIDQVKLSLGNGANTSTSNETLYVILGDAATATSGNLLGIYRTTNGGTGWTQVRAADTAGTLGNQSWYDIYVKVDPNDATNNTVYFGLVDVFKSTNAAGNAPTWTNKTNVYGASPAGIHPDQHVLMFIGTSLYAGNDGGIYKSTNGGTNFTSANGNLALSQFYDGAQSAQHPGTLIGGLQDNGEVKTTGSSWSEVQGGDGFYTAIDQTNDQVMYEEYVYGTVFKSGDGGSTWNQATTGMPSPVNQNIDNAQFGAALVMDPSNSQVLYSAHNHLWRSPDGAASWTNISSGVTPSTFITAVGVSKSAPGTLYIADYHAHMWVTPDTGAHWTAISSSNCASANAPNCSAFTYYNSVTNIAVDPSNANTVYATVSGFQGTQRDHIYRSTNGGTSWTDISTALPDVPFQSIAVSPTTPTTIYAGSDVGAYVSFDQGNNWYVLGNGLPHSRVFRIVPNAAGTQLTAFTFGRGVFQLPAPANPGNTPTITAAPTAVIAPSTTTDITYNTGDGSTGQVYVSVDGGSDVQISQGSTSTFNIPWVQTDHSYAFKLYAGVAHTTVLAQVTVVGTHPLGISASPTTVTYPSTTTTVTYGTGDGSMSQVYVSIDGGADTYIAQNFSGSFAIPWIQAGHTYVFKLFAGTAHTSSLGQVTVTGQAAPPVITASPTTVVGPATTTSLTYSTGDGTNGQVYVSVDGAAEILVSAGSATTASIPWISGGHTYFFTLYAGSSHTTALGHVSVIGQGGVPIVVANPSTVMSPSATTTISYSTGNGSTGQLYVAVDGGATQTLVSQGSTSAIDLTWISQGHIYIFTLYAGTAHVTPLGQTWAIGASGPTIRANPATVTTSPGGVGTTMLSFTTANGTTGQVYAVIDGGPVETMISQGTGGWFNVPWIQPGHSYVFKLYAGTAHASVLSQVSVTGQNPPPSISALPTTVIAPATTTQLTYSTGDGSVGQVYVAVDGGTQVLVTQGPGATVSIPWISTGHSYVFRLYAGLTHVTQLASTTVTGA